MVKGNKKRDLPAMPFYVGDWLKCPEVRALPPDCRGLWFDMLCYMWESTERGVMINPNGKPYSDSEIIRMVGLDNQNSGNWLTILLENGVCLRRDDGAIFSKRMVKDENIRQIRKESGSKGGNPALLDNQIDNQIDNQEVNLLSENENEKKKYIYSSFYDKEIEESKQDENYIKVVKILFGENSYDKPLNVLLKMPTQLSYKQFLKIWGLKKEYGIIISKVFEEIENWGNHKKNTTIYGTFLTFVKNENKNIKLK